MKSFFIKIAYSTVFFIFFVSCSSLKNKAINEKSTAFETDLSIDTKPFINPFFSESASEKHWIDSLYNQLSLQEKIGQLFMVAAYSNKDSAHIASIENLITNQKVGGLIFFQGGPVRQAKLTNRYQKISKTPLFIGIDAEWGLSMRLDSTYRYPWNMTLGAIKNTKLIEKVGQKMGQESKRLGVHFNFAPVVDINTNPKNPIIGFRSFGESKENVTACASALMLGVQKEGVFSTGKHFPGHGDTSTDSHYSLPLVNFSKERIETVELYPYKKLFREGLASVMVAHLNVPSLEPRKDYPSSISYSIVTNLLKNELKFEGLIFTDALNMKAASNYKKDTNTPASPGDIDLEAFLAGNDILLFSENVPKAAEKIELAINNGLITESRLEYSVKKILKYKYFAGLNSIKPIETNNLVTDISPVTNDDLLYELYENAVTVVKNNNSILPIKKVEAKKIAYVKLGDDDSNSFVSTLKKYTEITAVDHENLDSLLVTLKNFNLVIIGFHKSDKAWKNHDFSEKELVWLEQIAANNRVVLDVFTKPYSLLSIPSFDKIEAVVVSYQNAPISQIVSAELLFGAIGAKGKLPVSIGTHFKVNEGLATDKLPVLGFSTPNNVGMNPEILSKIDQIAQRAITEKMTPGAQILVARKGKVIYQKAFGKMTYDSDVKITNETIYDVASLTKIISTLPNVMQLYDKNKIQLDTKLSELLPVFANSDKKDILFKELLSHYARLQAWIPFYKETLDESNTPSEKYYRKVADNQFTKKVADSIFIRSDYQDTIISKIVNSKLLEKKEYKYSDFTFIILKQFLEKATHLSLDKLSEINFYSKLGMNNTLYNPLTKYDKDVIPPTEVDTYFRQQTIQGYVHDMEAAMEGGVGGHAGIFSNTMDIAKLMQMYIQKGKYGDHTYFSEKTFDTFNTCYFCKEANRRGLGFDKPQLGVSGPTCGCVPMTSFGHTGFTGTMAWADADNEIIYVFLSNRTFPDSKINTLSKENIREAIQKVIYESLQK